MLGTRLIGALLLTTAALQPAGAASMTDSDDDVAASLSGSGGKAAVVAFDAAPFPYRGMVPGEEDQDDAPFLDVHDGWRRGHTSSRGGVY